MDFDGDGLPKRAEGYLRTVDQRMADEAAGALPPNAERTAATTSHAVGAEGQTGIYVIRTLAGENDGARSGRVLFPRSIDISNGRRPTPPRPSNAFSLNWTRTVWNPRKEDPDPRFRNARVPLEVLPARFSEYPDRF